MRKTVCFVTPTYNASFHLEECYESLKEQSNPNWDWVILNDMSTDDTFEIANRIAILDGDDALCNENTVDLILKEYNNNPQLDALWTAHSWDINGMNISQELPGNLNPYQYPWVSSHLKTFNVNVFKKINPRNFQDMEGNWFERGYDQALFLPILYLARKRMFLDEICYLYRINSNSLKVRDWKEKNQMDAIRLVRARGYIT